ncbi:LpxI family protein, partial [Ferrovibrio sp.]|uniref:LpxI family protein n=1 Tax=Ferrovibrio sp. TaxID=1917215 RepID=UPI0025C17C0A
ALAAATALGAEDKGQAAVVARGDIVGLEDQAGTDAMLLRLRGNAAARGGVLAKCAKPGQERRVDLPAIGVTTLENAAAAGLSGVAVQAGAALIVDRPACMAAADRLGLFLVGVRMNG